MTALILFGLLIGLLFGPAIQFYLKYLVVLTVRARMKERAELFDELFEGLPPDAADLEPTPNQRCTELMLNEVHPHPHNHG